MRLASVLVVGAATAHALAAPPPGRVVRVERSRSINREAPVLCQMQNESSGMCVGAEPKQGDTLLVVGEARVVAEIRIKTAVAFQTGCDSMWTINAELVRGDLANASRSRTIGVIHGALDPHKATFIDDDTLAAPPDGGKGVGIDRDGDGVADILFGQADCDPQGHNARAGECFGIWNRDGKQLRRVSTLDVRRCVQSSRPAPPPPPPPPKP